MHVVIIGGGLAGLCATTSLAKAAAKSDLKITLVEPKDYVEIRWATIRAMFDETMVEGTTIPLADGLQKYPDVTHVRAKAQSMTATTVTLDDGQTLTFDACVVATGAVTPHAALQPDEPTAGARRAALAAEGARLAAAESVLVVGGGLIGAELAGDVAAYAAQAGRTPAVTLVHSGPDLAPPLAASSAAKLETRLAALGVKVVKGQRATRGDDDGAWTTGAGGEALAADVVVQATGVRPGDAARLLAGAGAAEAGEGGWAGADECGRVRGAGGAVFAFGDCVAGAYKSGAALLDQGGVLAKNIQAVLAAVQGGEKADGAVEGLKELPGHPLVVAVTAGPKAGVVMTPLFTDTLILPWLKNKTMFLSRAKGKLGI